MKKLTIIGGGLAGCEASWQAALRGVEVKLYEMKPHRHSAAHQSDMLAELVCSNSFRGDALENAVGLLKQEMRRAGSLVMEGAEATKVPAGGALAVDRELFAQYITEKISDHPLITVCREEIVAIPDDGMIIIASGPLTSDAFAEALSSLTGKKLYFYDAIAPVIYADSIDMNKVFAASRYGKGDGDDYLNCPFTEDEYKNFVAELNNGDKVEPKEFEKIVHFEGCMPVETLAERGVETLRFGPMKPVGLVSPYTGEEPYAVVQLRVENREKSSYNLVGFQTKLKYGEQKRIFRTIPGLENAEFARLGSMHRNTFINSPALLTPLQQLKSDPRIFFAGQITGVEGYAESAASGFLAGYTAAMLLSGAEPLLPPPESAFGALVRHLTESDPTHFQPSNINYGLFPGLPGRVKKKERKGMLAARAVEVAECWLEEIKKASGNIE